MMNVRWMAFWPVMMVSVIASAQEANLVEGSGVICNTPQQIVEVISVGTQEAMAKVNAREGKAACVYGHVRYERLEKVTEAVGPDHKLFDIVRIKIIAFYHLPTKAWMRVESPSDQYTAFATEATEI
jgi:hypothetical protein